MKTKTTQRTNAVLTAECKEFLKAYSANYTIREVSEILGKPILVVQGFMKHHSLPFVRVNPNSPTTTDRVQPSWEVNGYFDVNNYRLNVATI
jgi:hypothetical protein